MNKRVVLYAVLFALIVVLGITLVASAQSTIQGDWSKDCIGTRVTVDQIGIAHFVVSCNGLVMDEPEIEVKTKPKRDPGQILMGVGYPAPPTVIAPTPPPWQTPSA